MTSSDTPQATALDQARSRRNGQDESDKWEGWRGGSLEVGHRELTLEDLTPDVLAELEKELAQLRSGITMTVRMRDITAVMSKHGLGYIFKDSPLARYFSRSKDTRPAASLEDLGVRIREAFQELGPTFIKLGQVLVTRQELIPDEITHELARLLDRIPPMPFPYMATALARELPEGLKTFRFIDYEKPIGSASLAQVYKAELQDGTPVAVKIIRPGVPELFRTDIKAIRLFVRALHKALPQKYAAGLDLPGLVKDYYSSAEDEIDMTQEAQAMRDHHNMYDHLFDKLHIPQIHIATQNVMVMELIDGWNLKEFPTDFLSFEERLELMTQLAHYYVLAFLNGYFHADPHASNLLLNRHDKTVSPIDWGMVGRLDAVQTSSVIRLLLHLRLNQQQDAIEALLELVDPSKYTDLGQLREQLRAEFIHYVSSTQASKYNWGNLLITAIRIAMLNYCRIPNGLALFAKGWSAAEGTARWLCPEISYHELVEINEIPIMKNILGRRFDYRANAALAAETSQLVTQFPRRMSAIMKLLAWNELRVKHENTIAPDTMEALQKALNRAAMVSAAASVAGQMVYLRLLDRRNRKHS